MFQILIREVLETLSLIGRCRGDEIESLQTNVPSSSSSNEDGFLNYSMVHDICCSGDGGLIAAGLHTCDVLLADTQTFTIGRLNAHTSIVSNVHFSAFRPSRFNRIILNSSHLLILGDILLSASSDGTMVVWNLDPSSSNQDRAQSNFTEAERSLFDTALIESRIRLESFLCFIGTRMSFF